METLTGAMARLEAMGYVMQEGDRWLLETLGREVCRELLAACNRAALPEEWSERATRVVCGRFLRGKLAVGKLAGFDFEAAVQSVRLGDTDVRFVQSTEDSPARRFERMLDELCRISEGELVRCRKLCW